MPDKSRAIVSNWLTNSRKNIFYALRSVRLAELDSQKSCRIKDINLYPGTASTVTTDKLYSGHFLLTVGFNSDVTLARPSVVLEVTAAAS